MSILRMRPTLIPILIITLFAIAACNERQSNYTYKWSLIGEPFDSLMDRLEWQFNDFAPFDSIHNTIFLLDSTTKSLTNEKKQVATSRVFYWRARYLRRCYMSDSALKFITKALLLNDSSKNLYDRLRMISEKYANDDSINSIKKYLHFIEAINFARKIGDKGYEGYNSINIGNLLVDIGEYDKGLNYLLLGDSLYNCCGFWKIPIKNRLNIARLYDINGCPEKSDSILKTLLTHPYLERDTLTINTVLRNLWISTKKMSYLLHAYNDIKDSPNYRNLRGLYCALLAKEHYDEHNFDSVTYYADLSIKDLPYINNHLHKTKIWFSAGLSYNLKNRLDSALECRIRYEECLDSFRSAQHSTEIVKLNILHEMSRKETEYKASIQKRNFIIIFFIMSILSCSIVWKLLINRRNMRHKMVAMKNELELEKAKRKIAATTLSIEEKDKMLTAIRSELSEMRQEGEIKEGSARKLESTIKSHLLESDNEETFREMFDVLNPGFTERLRERCPGLADSYVKLASYILMELDNKRIASLMMIKPESVRQARWRLSQRLKLPENETLESFLRSLNDSIT